MKAIYNKYRFTTADPFFYDMLKEYARENRNNQTEAEELLWQRLSMNQLGAHFRRQHIIGCYIADFVCLRAKLIIEVDGGYHAQNTQQYLDQLRTEDLHSLGFRVIRFKNEEIQQNTTFVLDTIFNNIASNNL